MTLGTHDSNGTNFVPLYSQALVMAASRHSRLDTKSNPKCLLHIGERPLIHHVLQQLHRVKIKKVVITLGYEGEAIRKYVEENNVFDEMEIIFVYVPEQVWAIRGNACGVLEARQHITEPFILSTSDHIFEPKLMERVASTKFGNKEDGFVLVEKDMEGMVGLPASVVEVTFGENGFISGIGDDLDQVDALDAGLFLLKPSFFEQLDKVSQEKPYFTIADACNELALKNRLKSIETDGLTWFTIETKQSLAFAVENFKKYNRKSWFYLQSTKRKTFHTADGVEVVGSARKEDRSTTVTGGNWSEFSVEKWRSAVYTAASYFDQLYRDSVSFAQKVLDENGGAKRASIVEVGCGTGEFLFPMMKHSKHIVGVEINPKFTTWCQEHCPPSYEGHAQFICGDASKLHSLLKEKAPPSMWDTTRIVACVGNTFGIMSDELKNSIIQEMGKVAGPNGYVLIVYWNAEWFGHAIDNFYGRNLQLCGPFSEEDIDRPNTTLRSPSGYLTHWTGVEEAKEVVQRHGFKEIVVEAKGKGVIVLAQPQQF